MTTLARSSSLPGYSLCHGRRQAEQGLPDSANRYSEKGDRVHAMMATNDFTGASKDEMETVGALVRMSSQVEEDVIGAHKRHFVHKEHEFHVFDQGLPVIVGHPDRVVTWNQDGDFRALILDYKTGFLEVDSAEENLQLLCYALGVWQELGIKRIYAKIIMPMSKGHKVVEYDEAALKAGLEHVLGILAESAKENAPRTPSESACRYCKALGTARCPETLQLVETVVVEKGAVAMTPAERAQRLEMFSIAEKIIDNERAEFKALLEKDAEAVPGYYLKPGNTRRTIADSQQAYTAVESLVPLEAFQKTLTVNVGKLEDAIADACGLKGKALDEKCAELLGPIIVENQNAPSLAKMTKAMLKERGLA